MRIIFIIYLLVLSFSASAQDSKETESEKVYTYVDVMPEFPGGEIEMLRYIKANIDYPSESIRNNVEGLTFLSLVVRRDGTLDEVHVMKSLDPYTDKEAIRIVSTMPKWKPGIKNGKNVNVKYTLVLRFKLPLE